MPLRETRALSLRLVQLTIRVLPVRRRSTTSEILGQAPFAEEARWAQVLYTIPSTRQFGQSEVTLLVILPVLVTRRPLPLLLFTNTRAPR